MCSPESTTSKIAFDRVCAGLERSSVEEDGVLFCCFVIHDDDG